MNKKVDVKYNPEYLKLLKHLSNINEKILIKKTDDQKEIEIEGKNIATTVAYTLKTKIEDFQFDGDEVGFYQFPEFFELFDAFDSPKIKQHDAKFEIIKDKSKITYYTADPESIPAIFKKIKFEEPDASFTLTEDDMNHIKKMIGLVDADAVSFIVEDNVLTVVLAGDEKDNSYQKEYEIEDSIDVDISIPTRIFEVAPKGDYEIQIKEEGVMRFIYKNEQKFELNLYTAENEDD